MRKFKQKIVSALTAAAMALGLSVSLPAAIQTSAEDVNSLSAMEITHRMKLGWNLGNTLDAYDDNKPNLLISENAWENPRAAKDVFRAVKAKGFTTVRIPVTWHNHMNSSYQADSEWFGRVHEVVDYAVDEGLYVILNAHHEEWNKPTPDNCSAASYELEVLWTQIANEFSSYDKHLIFEGMNEPRYYNGGEANHEWDGGIQEY